MCRLQIKSKPIPKAQTHPALSSSSSFEPDAVLVGGSSGRILQDPPLLVLPSRCVSVASFATVFSIRLPPAVISDMWGLRAARCFFARFRRACERRENFFYSNKLNLKHFSNFKYHDRWDYFKKILKLNLTKPERIVRLYFSMSYYILRKMNYEERFSLICKLLQSNLNPAVQKISISVDGLPVTFLNELIYFQC